MKNLKESIYHDAVACKCSSCRFYNAWKIINKNSLPSLRKFLVEDGVKLVEIITVSVFAKDYLIKQKYFLTVYTYTWLLKIYERFERKHLSWRSCM